MKVYTLWWPIHPEKDAQWYEDKSSRMSEDQIASELDINYAQSISGRVFNQFKTPRHTTDEFLFTPKRPVYRIWDFGRVNATLYLQVDDYGRKRILHERVLENSNTPDQIDVGLQDSSDKFQRAYFVDICDPAGSYKDERGNRPDIELLNDADIYPMYETVLRLPHRERKRRGLDLIKVDLQKTPGGEEGLLINRHNCPLIIKALEGGYAYKKDHAGNILDTIKETHPYEDVIDCLIYFYLESGNDNRVDDFDFGYDTGYVSPYLGF